MLWSYASWMSSCSPAMVALAGGKFQRAHGMSFCGGSANVLVLSGVTGLSAAKAAALGGVPLDARASGAPAAPPMTMAAAADATAMVLVFKVPLLYSRDRDRPTSTRFYRRPIAVRARGAPSTSRRRGGFAYGSTRAWGSCSRESMPSLR